MERNGSSKTFVISLSRSLSKATTQRPSLNRVAVPVLPLRSCRPRPEIVTRAPAERAISSPVHQLELVGWLDQHQVCCGGLSSGVAANQFAREVCWHEEGEARVDRAAWQIDRIDR